MASASLSLLAGNGSGGGAGLGGGVRSTGPGGGGIMASSAGGGWFSMRRDDRGSEELSWKSENATQRGSSASVLESFPELVTCKKCFREVTTQIWSGELFRGLSGRQANVPRTI